MELGVEQISFSARFYESYKGSLWILDCKILLRECLK